MNALVIRNAEAVSISVAEGAVAQKAAALATAADVVEVTDDFGAECAADAIRALKGLLGSVEAARKEVKAPVLAIGKKIDATAEEFAAELVKESARVTGLLNAYQIRQREAAEAERRRIEQEERQRQAEQRRLEEEKRKAEEAAAAPFDAAEKAQAEKDAEAARRRQAELAAESAKARAVPVMAPVKPSGVVVVDVWEFEVLDVVALYAARPELVRLEPKAREINAALSAGLRNCPGLRIWKETKTTVRR